MGGKRRRNCCKNQTALKFEGKGTALLRNTFREFFAGFSSGEFAADRMKKEEFRQGGYFKEFG